MYLISTTHSSLISYTFDFWRCICPRLPHCLTGTLQADAWHRTTHGFSKGLADYNPKSILCSLAVPMYHYPLVSDPRKRPPRSLFQLKMIRSKQKRHKRTPSLTFWSDFFHALFICPRVFLPRFYLRERTCNAGMRLSKYTGKIYLPIK